MEEPHICLLGAWNIRNLNNAIMGFSTVQRGLIGPFFTHIAYILIFRQWFNPSMQADLPGQTSTHKYQIYLLKWNAKTTEVPNWIAKLSNWICFDKLKFQTELPNWIAQLSNWICFAKLNCQAELSNWFHFSILTCQTELPNCQIEFFLPNWIAKLNCRTELRNKIAELSNWIHFAKLNCQTELSNWIRFAKLNCQTELPTRIV